MVPGVYFVKWKCENNVNRENICISPDTPEEL